MSDIEAIRQYMAIAERALSYLRDYSDMVYRQNCELSAALIETANAQMAQYRDSGVVPLNVEALQTRVLMERHLRDLAAFRERWGEYGE